MADPKSPIVKGLEEYERVYAKDQPGVAPLPCLRGVQGQVMSRWELTDEERERIAGGADVYVVQWTCWNPLQPVSVEIAGVLQNPETVKIAMQLDQERALVEEVERQRLAESAPVTETVQ